MSLSIQRCDSQVEGQAAHAGGPPALPVKSSSGRSWRTAMRRGLYQLVVVLIAGLLVSSNAIDAQEPQSIETVRIDTNLISVPVIVRDRDGRYVPGLRVQDFTILDDGVARDIAFFDAAEEPLNVVLMLDTSRSTEGVLDDIRKAAKNFLNELRPRDRAMIVSFDYALHKLSPLTSDRKLLESAIKHAEIGEELGTVLNDAVMEISASVLQPITGRKAIILLTDGEDHGSLATSAELISAVSHADAMIYSVYYESEMRDFGGRDRRGRGGRGGWPGGRCRPFFNLTPPQRPGRAQGPGRGGPREDPVEFLTNLSESTGGRFYRSKKTDLKKTFAMVADELRSQYRLGFYPDKNATAGVLHSLKVKVDRQDVAIRSRYQYRTKQGEGAGN
jgi:VWFA-related protein